LVWQDLQLVLKHGKIAKPPALHKALGAFSWYFYLFSSKLLLFPAKYDIIYLYYVIILEEKSIMTKHNKRIFPRIIALLLSLCLALSLAMPLSAAGPEAEACDCGQVLQVFVRGFLRELYFDYGQPTQREAMIPLHLLMTDQGTSILPITKTWVIPPDQCHRAEPEYEFLYDYRLNAFEMAAELNDFINALREETGHDKIALTGMSQGTSIVMTYVAVYGTEHLETLILINGSYQGAILLGELMTNRWALSVPATINFIESFLPASPQIAAMFDVLRFMPLAGFRTPASGDTCGPLGSMAYNAVITRLLGHMPAIWTFLPEEYYAEARKLLDGDARYDHLRTQADRYYNTVQTQVPRLLDEAMADGVKVAVIAAYGAAPIPLLDDAYHQGDLIINTANMSGGATTARVGELLPADDANRYLSPDRIIDASTANLPDHTWFIKYNGHDFMPSEALRQWIIAFDTSGGDYPSIWSNAAFPQYLRLTGDGGTESLDEGPIVKPGTVQEAFANLISILGF